MRTLGLSPKLVLLFCGFGLITSSPIMNVQIPGGVSVQEYPLDAATKELLGPMQFTVRRAIADKVLTYAVAPFEKYLNNLHLALTLTPVEPLSYKTQVVNGMNYFVKYRMHDQCFHVKIYKNYDGVPKVVNVKGAISCEAPIVFFD